MSDFNRQVDSVIVSHNALNKAMGRILRLIDNSGGYVNAKGITVTGPAGSGKTTIIEILRDRYPGKKTQFKNIVPILVVTIPAEPTIKGVASALLFQLGDAFCETRETENVKTQRLIQLMQKCGVIAIVLDEAQHFSDSKSNEAIYTVSNWLKSLMDQTRVVTILVGLPKLNQIINGNAQMVRRFERGIELNKFSWVDEQSRVQFMAVLGAFQTSLNGLSFPALSSEAMAFRFYAATGGLMANIVKIIGSAVLEAESEHRSAITMSDLARGWEDSIRVIDPDMVCNPFTDAFDQIPTEQSLVGAKEIGKDIAPSPPKRRGPNKKQRDLSL